MRLSSGSLETGHKCAKCAIARRIRIKVGFEEIEKE